MALKVAAAHAASDAMTTVLFIVSVLVVMEESWLREWCRDLQKYTVSVSYCRNVKGHEKWKKDWRGSQFIVVPIPCPASKASTSIDQLDSQSTVSLRITVEHVSSDRSNGHKETASGLCGPLDVEI